MKWPLIEDPLYVQNSKHEKKPEFVDGVDPAEADYYELPCRNLLYFFSDKAEFFPLPKQSQTSRSIL